MLAGNLRCVIAVFVAALGIAPASAQNLQLEVVPNVTARTHTICSSGLLNPFGGGSAQPCPPVGGGICGDAANPWQTSDPNLSCWACGTQVAWQGTNPSGACYAACGSRENPWQTSNPSAPCYDCGPPRNPWQNQHPTADCYKPCGSPEFPWQTSDPRAPCYDCGSTRNPWQNGDPAAACYKPCGSTQFPWQSTDSSLPCYNPPWLCADVAPEGHPPERIIPKQSADPDAPCYDPDIVNPELWLCADVAPEGHPPERVIPMQSVDRNAPCYQATCSISHWHVEDDLDADIFNHAHPIVDGETHFHGGTREQVGYPGVLHCYEGTVTFRGSDPVSQRCSVSHSHDVIGEGGGIYSHVHPIEPNTRHTHGTDHTDSPFLDCGGGWVGPSDRRGEPVSARGSISHLHDAAGAGDTGGLFQHTHPVEPDTRHGHGAWSTKSEWLTCEL